MKRTAGITAGLWSIAWAVSGSWMQSMSEAVWWPSTALRAGCRATRSLCYRCRPDRHCSRIRGSWHGPQDSYCTAYLGTMSHEQKPGPCSQSGKPCCYYCATVTERIKCWQKLPVIYKWTLFQNTVCTLIKLARAMSFRGICTGFNLVFLFFKIPIQDSLKNSGNCYCVYPGKINKIKMKLYNLDKEPLTSL